MLKAPPNGINFMFYSSFKKQSISICLAVVCQTNFSSWKEWNWFAMNLWKSRQLVDLKGATGVTICPRSITGQNRAGEITKRRALPQEHFIKPWSVSFLMNLIFLYWENSVFYLTNECYNSALI